MRISKKTKILIKINIKLFIHEYSTLVLFLISYIIYYLSLEPCLDGEEICGNNMKWIYKKLFQIILSCEISVLAIIKILFYDSSKLHFIHLIIVFGIFLFRYHDFVFINHGMYNFLTFIIVLFLNLFILLIFKAIIFIFKIKSKIYIALKFLLIFFLFLVYRYKFPNIECEDWGKGLNNTSIDNNNEKYGCQIRLPKYCQYKLFSSFQDYTKILGVNCSQKKTNSRKVIFKKSKSPYITKNTKKFGLPFTNKGMIGCLDGLDSDVLKDYVFNNIFDVDENKNFSEPEVVADFSKDSLGELHINLKYNDSLSKERKNLENKTIPYSNNILIIYIDSVSRASSVRKLNKTLNFFEKFISFKGGFNQKYPEEKFHSFQFFKYHSFMGRTAGNYPRIYYGNKREAKNIVRMNKYFQDNGYITNHCCELCQKDNSRTLHDTSLDELYDYQLLLCGPNIPRYHKPIIKCLYGQNEISYLFNYSEQFWRKYQNNRKFSNIIIDGAHEGTMEVLKYFDDIIYNYLISLFDDNLLKDSSIFLLSDHGVGLQSIYYLFDFYLFESDLPMLYMIINDRKNISYSTQYYYLQQNQQTLITAYDIYNTINNLLFGDNYRYILNLTDEKPTPKSPYGISLFEKIDQKLRKPTNYEDMIHYLCI